MDQQSCFVAWDEDDGNARGQAHGASPQVRRHMTPEQLSGQHVLVPFCGTCADLGYLAAHAATVTGVEISADVIARCAAENALDLIQEGPTWRCDNLTIRCTDFFDMTAQKIGRVDIIYDQGALTALAPDRRECFVQKIHGLLPVGGVQYVRTLEFAPDQAQPPFSLSPDQLRRWYGLTHEIEHLEDGLLSDHPLIAARGLEYLRAHFFRLTRFF